MHCYLCFVQSHLVAPVKLCQGLGSGICVRPRGVRGKMNVNMFKGISNPFGICAGHEALCIQ